MKKFAIFLKKTLTNKGYYPRLIFDETTNTCSIMKNKNVIIPLGGDGSETDLSNYYDKDETNALLDDKANTADVYTKSEVYTQAEVEALLLALENRINDLEDRIAALESPVEEE